jgi:hypothetical protein
LELQALKTDLRVQVDELRMCVRLPCDARNPSVKNVG